MAERILITKLTNGEEIIGETSYKDDNVIITNPFYIFLNQSNGSKDVIMTEYVPMARERKTVIPKKDVSFSYEAAEKLENKYRELFGSKIILAKSLLTE